MPFIIDGDIKTPWSSKYKAELLTGQSDDRRVDQWHYFGHMFTYESIEELLVAVL